MRNQQHVGLSVVSFIAIELIHVVSEHRDHRSLQHDDLGQGHRDTDEIGGESLTDTSDGDASDKRLTHQETAQGWRETPNNPFNGM